MLQHLTMKVLGSLLLIPVFAVATLSSQTAPAVPAEKPRTAAPPAASQGALPDLLHVQVLLDRAGFSPGAIDGTAGKITTAALTAYQQANGLPATGTPDQATLEKLGGIGVSPVLDYTITPEDAAGPFEPVPEDMMDKSKLQRLGYSSLLEALSERFHASPKLLERLNGHTKFAAGATIKVPNIVTSMPTQMTSAQTPQRGKPSRAVGTTGAAKTSATIVVSKETGALTLEGSDGAILFYAPVTVGSEQDPLPVGKWAVTAVLRDPPFHYNPDLFWDADPTHAKAKIPPGPNNPVGVVWIDLTKEHYGIHGTPEPTRIGYTESHGCVRLTNWDAERLASMIGKGTPVIFK